jgi:DNA-binding NarL/FixJ family response regulator
MKRARIILADDHLLLLDAFRNLLQTEFEVVGTFADGRALVRNAVALAPDVIVLDISMPEMDGLIAGEMLKEILPAVKLVYLTMNLDAEIAAQAFRLGASGYVAKHSAAAELLEAIRRVLHGGSYMSPLLTRTNPGAVVRDHQQNVPQLTLRQKEVLRLLAEGRSMKQVAYVLKLTTRTVAYHKYSMMEHLQLRSSAELIRFAVTHSLAGSA